MILVAASVGIGAAMVTAFADPVVRDMLAAEFTVNFCVPRQRDQGQRRAN